MGVQESMKEIRAKAQAREQRNARRLKTATGLLLSSLCVGGLKTIEQYVPQLTDKQTTRTAEARIVVPVQQAPMSPVPYGPPIELFEQEARSRLHNLPHIRPTMSYNLYVVPQVEDSIAALQITDSMRAQGYKVFNKDDLPAIRFKTDKQLDSIMQQLESESVPAKLIWQDGEKARQIKYVPHEDLERQYHALITKYVQQEASYHNLIAKNTLKAIKFVHSIGGAESDFNFYRASNMGAIGIMQTMAESALDVDLQDNGTKKTDLPEQQLAQLKDIYSYKLWNLEEHVKYGSRLALEALEQAHGNVTLAANIYSRGYRRATDGSPKPRETKIHERRVWNYFRDYNHHMQELFGDNMTQMQAYHRG